MSHEIFSIVDNTSGFFCTLETSTVAKPAAPTKQRPELRKLSTFRARVGTSLDYENAVNIRRAKEGNEEEFQAAAKRNGIRSVNGFRAEKDGKDYCIVYPVKGGNIEEKYMLGDKEIPLAEARAMLPVKNYTSRQDIENEVIYREYLAENIKAITINGKRHTF